MAPTPLGELTDEEVFGTAAPPAAPSPEDAFGKAILFAENTKPGIVQKRTGARTPWQVLPSTAKNPGFGIAPAKDDTDAEYARVGEQYSKALLNRYGGNPALAGMAYNAGFGNVDQWLKSFGDPRTGAISEDEFVKKVPFQEARNYAGNVRKALGANAAPAAPAGPRELSEEEVFGAAPATAAVPPLSKGVLPNGLLPGHEGNLDPAKAGDNWATFELSEDGIPKHYVLPTLPGDNNTPNDETGFMGDAVERFKKTGQNYGAFDSDEAGAARMKGAAAPPAYVPNPEAARARGEALPMLSMEAIQALPSQEPAGVPPGMTRLNMLSEWMKKSTEGGRHPNMPSVGDALTRGVARAAVESGQAGESAPKVLPEGPEAEPLLAGPIGEIPQKLAYGLGKNFPELAGGILGGTIGASTKAGPVVGGIGGAAAGATLTHALQVIGPNFAHELQATPDDPDGAYERAWATTGEDAAATGLAWAAFGITPFKGAIKNLLFQGLVFQPATAAATQEARNLIHGRPEFEGTTEAAAETAMQTPIMLGVHGVVSALGGVRGGARTAEAPAEPASEPPPPPPEAGRVAPPPPPPGVPPGGPAAPVSPFGEGEIISLRDPKGGAPKDVTVIGQSGDGKLTAVQFEDGSVRDMPTDYLTKNIAPPTEAVAEEPPTPPASEEYGRELTEEEVFNVPPEDYEAPAGREPGEDVAEPETAESAPYTKMSPSEAAAEAELPMPAETGTKAAPARAEQTSVAPKLFIHIGSRSWPVDSYKDASEKFRATIDELGVGASGTPQAIIKDGSGKELGYVAYNGRIFEGRPQDWRSGTKKLYDPAAADEGTKLVPVRAPETDQDIEPARAQVEQPTPAQAAVGNYKKGHIADFHGMNITIETPKGATREGAARSGETWSNVNGMADYGEVKGTVGADKDHVDVYIGPNPKSEKAYVIDQINLETGKFDEHKGVLGADSAEQAAAIYDDGFSDGRGAERRRDIKEMSVSEFREWVKTPGARTAIAPQPIGQNVTHETKPVAEPTSRPLDDNKRPIFHKDERVVINDEGPMKGRHGTIVQANGLTMRPIFGGGNSSTSYHYVVKTDEGHETFASDMAEETEKPAKIVPDPVIDGHSMPPHLVRSGIDYAKKSARDQHAMAARSRKPQNRLSHLRSAKASEDKAAKYQAALDAWMKKNPEAAPAAAEAKPVPAPTSQAPVAKATYAENDSKDGVEIKFKDRPDDATLGRLKAAGFRWSKFQKLWYAKRTPKTLELAKELAAGKPAPQAAGPSAGDETIQHIPSKPVAPSGAGMDVTAFRRALERTGAAQMNGLWRIVPDAGSGYAVEHTPPDGRRETLRAPQTENTWSLDKARDAAVEAAFGPRVPAATAEAGRAVVGRFLSGVKPEWTQIGTNGLGHALYVDQRGVRSYVTNGVRRSEPVGIRPTRAGVEFTVNRPASREFEPETPTERIDVQANEEGARAEIDDEIYQPGGMPITSAIPPEPKLSDFKRGDQVDVRPEYRQLIARSVNRIVTDVSANGQFLTLDGGSKIEASWVMPAEEPIQYPPGLIPGAETPTLSTEAGANGIPEPVSARPAGQRPETVPGVGALGANRPTPQGENGGGIRPAGPTPGVGAEGAGRPAQRPAGPAAGGGAGYGADVGIPGPGERPKPGTAGRHPDANVQGTDYRIEPGEIAEGRGPKVKALDNLNAIEIVKALKAEDRLATRDEQAALARYVGWGGLSGAFKNNQGKFGAGLEDVGRRLQEILTPEEYATASKSTQYAHYTAEHVIRSMWDAVRKMGFEGGTVFEPGMGVGHFLGMMPGDIAENSKYQGVEMDYLTADIAKALYPESGVRQADFTEMPLPENSFDLVIGNPPFSDTVIKADPKYAAKNFMLHDYFFAKSLDAVRPGGLLAFVTSAGTMNKADNNARLYLAQRAEFLGGVRLPSTAFKKNAGTEVTTDILFFQKRPELTPLNSAEIGNHTAWTSVVTRNLPNAEGGKGSANVSRYFTEHPEQVLGREGLFDKLYKGRYAVHEYPGANLEQDLADALNLLPKDIYETAASPDTPEQLERDFAAPETKDGSFYLKDGRLMQYAGGAGKAVQGRAKGVKGGVTAADRERILQLIPVRDAVRDVFKADLAENAADAVLARAALNSSYDAFVKKFGPINKAEFQYRRPTIVQQEIARAEAREDARARGENWLEGDFDATEMIGDVSIDDIEDAEEEDAGAKKRRQGPSWSEIARARQSARIKAEASGKPFDEGSFKPEEMPDVVIDKRPNINPFMDDPESYRLRSIEEYNEQTGESRKRRVFTESVLTREQEPDIRSAQDGVLWSLNKFGRLNLDAIAAKRGQTKDALLAELGDSTYRVPGTSGTYQMADEYLSGDILDKLDTAKKYAETDASMARNVSALEAARPAPLPPTEIRMSLGMPWIPSNLLEEFARDNLGLGSDVYIRHSGVLGGWTVRVGKPGPNFARWSTEDLNATKVLQEALNRTKPRIYRWEGHGADRKSVLDPIATQAVSDRIDEISNTFAAYDGSGSLIGGWLQDSPEKLESLAGIYNNTLNRTVLRNYDGAYLTTPGIASDWKWRPHQRRAVARVILSGNTYVGHSVGAGKTSIYIGAGMEMRRLGLVKKPMYVVPNIMLAQFTKEFYEQYPTAKIAVADERRFHTKRRKQFMANVAQEDLDAIIITHSSANMIPIGAKFQAKLIEEEIANIVEAMKDLDKQSDRITIKKLENKKEKLEQRMKGAFASKKDQTQTFEEMGIDFLFVDEAHLFRKLDFSSRQAIKGIDGDGSARAFNLYSKIRYLESKTPGRSVVMGSGTPVTNTMGELYTLSKYMQRGALEKRGIGHFDSWAASFGETTTNTEPTPQGTYERVTRFARFVNSYELYKMVGEVMDVVTPQQLEQYVVRPKIKGGKRELHLAPKTEAFERFQASLVRRVNEIKARKGPPKKGDDILLSVINDGRHAAIDLRFVQMASDDPNSKLNMMLSNVIDIYKKTGDARFFDPATNYQKEIARGPATQMVFSNLGVNGRGPMDFSTYKWIERKLTGAGIPRNEIAFIGNYKSHVSRQKLFNDMNSGKVRILVGSTQKMGMGVNAQRRLIALHNLDPLWFPSDDEQRIGRGLRQGNWNPLLEIHDYATKGTYDEQMWQMMGRKARFIEQFFRGDPTLRTMEDLGEASFYEQASAIAASDERVIKLTELRHDLEKLERQSAAHAREQYSMRAKMGRAQEDVERSDKAIPVLQGDIAKRVPTRGDEFRMRIGNKEFDKRADAADVLAREIETALNKMSSGERETIGELGGFPLLIGLKGKDDFRIYIRHSDRSLGEVETFAETPVGIVRGIENYIDSFERRIGYWEKSKASAIETIASLRPQIGKPFAKEGEIPALRREIAKLERAITPSKPLNTVSDVDQAIKENADDYHHGRVDHDEFTAKARSLHERREAILNPPKPDEDAALYQVPKAAPTFFSALERAVEGIKQDKAGVGQWRATIKNLPGVKQDEIDWLGLNEWLAPQSGTLTKAQILDFIRANNVQIKEVMKRGARATEGLFPENLRDWEHDPDETTFYESESGARDPRNGIWRYPRNDIWRFGSATVEYHYDTRGNLLRVSAQLGDLELGDFGDFIEAREALIRAAGRGLFIDVTQHADDGRWWTRDLSTGEDIADYATREGALEAAEELDRERPGAAKFETYTLPGGENYRELLLTLPVDQNRAAEAKSARVKELIARRDALQAHMSTVGVIGSATAELRRQIENTNRQIDMAMAEPPRDPGSFRSGHFEEPNIVAHIRFNDRVDADGKKTMFIEEIQSDFGQQIRRQRQAISAAVDTDFHGIVARMKNAGVLAEDCT